MWVGTENGLNRFNGSEFVLFDEELPDDNIKSIVKDSIGNLWIGTGNGLVLYEPKFARFTSFTEVGDCENCLAGRIIKDLEIDGDNIWIGTNAGLSKIEIGSKKITSWWYDENTDVVESLFSIRDVDVINRNILALATNKGLIIYDFINDSFSYFGKNEGLKTLGLEEVFKDRLGQYWLASDRDGIYKVKGEILNPQFELQPHLIEKSGEVLTAYDFAEDDQGRLWVCSFYGVTILDQENESLEFLYHDPKKESSLNQSTVKSIYKDSEGRMWLGNPTGINVYDPYFNQFEVIDEVNGEPIDNVFAIIEDSQKSIWIGTQSNGLIKLNEDGTSEKLLPGKAIYALAEDRNGSVWVSSPDDLRVISKGNMDRLEKLPTSSIYQIIHETNGNTWIATHGEGVLKLNENREITQFKYFNNDPLQTNKNYVINMDFDERGRIWLGNFNLGGAIIKDKELDSLFYPLKGHHPFYLKNVNDFLIDDQSILLSTIDGLYYFPDKEALINDSLPEYEKISDNFSYELIAENDNEIWASSTEGLYKIDLNTLSLKSYLHQFPLQFNNFNHNAAFRTSDGIIYLGSAGGLVKFHPDYISDNSEKPVLVFKDFRILNKRVSVVSDSTDGRSIPFHISHLDKITLNPADKIFSVGIDVINYRANEAITLEYFLEGFDQKWQISDNFVITRSNLAPGNYLLKVRASNNDGVLSDEVTLSINVLAPWWRKWWAYLLYAILAIAAFFTFSFIRVQQERKLEAVRSAERDAFRKRSAEDFHDEAGTKITRISLLTELAKRDSGTNSKLVSTLSKIEQNIEELNNGMRDFIWSLDIDKDNLYDTFTRFVDFAGTICNDANVLFKSEYIDPALMQVRTEMEERRNLLLLLKEALNNSLKHGNPSNIAFSVVNSSQEIIIKLKDDGTGFDPNTVSNGNGLKNMKSRAESLDAKLLISSAELKGTMVELVLSPD